MHARAPVGTRVEETANAASPTSRRRSARSSRRASSTTLVDNIGMPVSGINMTYNNTGTIGTQDGDIQIKLREGHRPTADYVRTLREELPRALPGRDLLVPAGRHRQPDPQFRRAGADRPADPRPQSRRELRLRAQAAARRSATCPASPTRASSSRATARASNVDVDRTRAQYVGSPSATSPTAWWSTSPAASQVAPTFWLNPENGVSYSDRDADAAVPDRLAQRAAATCRSPRPARRRCRCSAASPTSRAATRSAVVSQYNIQTDGPDLRHHAGPRPRRGGGRHPEDRRRDARATCRRARTVALLGQVRTMNQRVRRPAVRPARRDRADLPADRRQFPVVARSVRHHHGAAGRARRHRLDAVRDRTRRCRCRR